MKKNWWKIGLIILGGCLVLKYFEAILAFLSMLFGVGAPLLLGCVIAYILNIPLRFLERHAAWMDKKKWLAKLKRPVCILASVGIIVVILVLVVNLIVPELAGSVQVLAKAIPAAINQAVDFVSAHAEDIPALAEYLENLQLDWPKIFENVLDFAKTGIGSVFNSAFSLVSVIFGGVFNFVIGIIFAVYLLANKEKLAGQLHKLSQAYVSPRIRSVCTEFVQVADQTFASFIVGQCTEAVILGTLCAIGMLILRLPYAVMSGVIIGVTALIPIVGAYVGAVLCGFMIIMVDPMQALIFVIFLVILQQLEGNIIYPKVVGSSIGLPGMWVLSAVTIGGGIAGIPGMLVGVPLAAAIYKWIGRCTNIRLEKQQTEKPAEGEATDGEGSGEAEGTD